MTDDNGKKRKRTCTTGLSGSGDLHHMVKYKNRRIYDLTSSKYVNYTDIESLIKNNVSLNIICDESKNDITKSILYDVLVKMENFKNIFTLDHIIRMIGNLK